jgi:hypothetical protein
MSEVYSDIKDEGLFSTGNIIIFSFLFLLILLIGKYYLINFIVYLYFANKALIAQGGYKKKKSHKSKKGQEFWSYGD